MYASFWQQQCLAVCHHHHPHPHPHHHEDDDDEKDVNIKKKSSREGEKNVLLHLTLGDTSELEEEAAGGRRLARVDVAADDDGHVGLP